jgi:nucleoside-diphosphate-sugar epimerase
MSLTMKVCVTGATGMIGSRLVPQLLERGYTVVCPVRSIAKAESIASLCGAHFVEADLTVPDTVAGITEGCDAVIHLAVLGHLHQTRHAQDEFMRVNVVGLSHVLDDCQTTRPQRIIVASTSATQGATKEAVITEETPANPDTPYGRSKHAADRLVREYVEAEELPVILLRFTHVYGPGDTRDFLKIVRWIRKGIFPQVGLGQNTYPALYIDDAVHALLLSLERGQPGQCYIITDDDPHDTREIRRLVRKGLGLPLLPYPVIPKTLGYTLAAATEAVYHKLGRQPPVSPRNLKNLASGRRFSIEKATRDLGFHPQVSLEEGIRRTMAWYQSQELI